MTKLFNQIWRVMKTSNQTLRNKYTSSQRQLLTVKTQNLNHFDARWAQIKISGKNIPNRSNHASVIKGEFMYVHGGYDVDKGILGDFNRIDLSELNRDKDYFWTQLSNVCEGKQIKLKNHTAVTFQDKIVIFGGQISSAQSSDATYIYSISSNTWSKLKSNTQLPGVDSHCVSVLDQKMYVYAGYIPSKAQLMTDLYALDLRKLTWQRIYHSTGTDKQPQGRSCCSMIAHENSLYIFGGSNGINTLNDFWQFSTTSKQWGVIQTQNTPSPRRGQSMLVFHNYIFMFGGIQDIIKQKNDVYIYQFSKKNWKKIHTTTNSVYDCSPTLKRQRKQTKVPGRLTLVGISPEKNQLQSDIMKKILIENKQKKFQQRKKELLKQFSQKPAQSTQQRSFSPTTQSMLKTLQAIGNQETIRKQAKQQIIYDETNRKIIGKKPCARDGQTICVKEDFMYIFGGDRHLMAFNDLYSFDLGKGIKSLQLYANKETPSEQLPNKQAVQNTPKAFQSDKS